MKTRLRFKIIAVLICLSLVGLLISQGYWLKGLYVSSKKSTWDNIEDAMRMADYMELFLRLDSLSNNNFHSQINPQFSFSQDTAWIKETGHHRPVPPAGNPERSERLRIICLYGCFRKRGILERRCPLHTCDRTGILLRIGTPIS